MPKPSTIRPGFTLIELLIYLGMSSIIVVMISTFMVDISHSAARTRGALNLQNNSQLILSRITQAVRTANGPLSYASNVLTIPVAGGNQTYTLTGTSLIETLPPPSASTGALNSAETAVEAFDVSLFDIGGQPAGVTITMTVGTSAALTPPVTDYTVTSTIVRRQPLYQ